MPTKKQADAIAKRRAAAKSGGKTATAAKPKKAAPKKSKPKAEAPEEFTVEYEFSSLTKNKVRYDAVDPDDCYGMDRQYISKDALGGVAKESDAPQSITVTVTVG